VQRGTEEELADCFAMLTERAARIMRRNDYGIAWAIPPISSCGTRKRRRKSSRPWRRR
jgi:hypothetical protein